MGQGANKFLKASIMGVKILTDTSADKLTRKSIHELARWADGLKGWTHRMVGDRPNISKVSKVDKLKANEPAPRIDG